jgi:hypothetical protein
MAKQIVLLKDLTPMSEEKPMKLDATVTIPLLFCFPVPPLNF